MPRVSLCKRLLTTGFLLFCLCVTNAVSNGTYSLIPLFSMELTCCLLLQLYRKCGEAERSVGILEDYLKNHPNEADLSVIHLLAVMLMEDNAYLKALDLIEFAKQRYFTGKWMPLNLSIKAGICHLHLGHMEEAEVCWSSVLKFLVVSSSAITHSNWHVMQCKG